MILFEQRAAVPCAWIIDESAKAAAQLRERVGQLLACEVRTLTSFAHAIRRLSSETPGLILTEAKVNGESCADFVRSALRALPPPLVVITGSKANRARLSQLVMDWADAAASRPVLRAFADEDASAFGTGLDLIDHVARKLVGCIGMSEAQLQVRKAMCEEAITRTNGSRRAAARLLRIDRRYVQHLVSADGPCELKPAGSVL